MTRVYRGWREFVEKQAHACAPVAVISRCINRLKMENFGFPRNLITLTSSLPSPLVAPRPAPRFPSSRDPLFPAASRMAFFLCPVEPLRDPPATIRMRYIIKYFCVRAAGDNRGS